MKRKSKINQILEMPREIDNKEPKITIISFDEIFLDENLSEGMSRPLNKEERNKLIKKAAHY